MVTGASGLSDADISKLVADQDSGVVTDHSRIQLQRIQEKKEEEERERREEEQIKQREREILDYSARVEGDNILVRIDEDEDKMRRAMDRWNQAYM